MNLNILKDTVSFTEYIKSTLSQYVGTSQNIDASTTTSIMARWNKGHKRYLLL